FQDVASLSDVDQSVDADIYVVERWRDPRLADSRRPDGSADCPPPEGRLWMPALEPESIRGRQAFYPAHFLVDGRGVVTSVRRLWVKVSYPLDFRDFPSTGIAGCSASGPSSPDPTRSCSIRCAA